MNRSKQDIEYFQWKHLVSKSVQNWCFNQENNVSMYASTFICNVYNGHEAKMHTL